MVLHILHHRYAYPTKENKGYKATFGNAWGIMGVAKSKKELSRIDLKKRLAQEKGKIIFYGFFGEPRGAVSVPKIIAEYDYFVQDVEGKGDIAVIGFYECVCNNDAIMERSLGEIFPFKLFENMEEAVEYSNVLLTKPPFSKVAYGDNDMASVTWHKIMPMKLWELT